jgi:hypothetical protein
MKSAILFLLAAVCLVGCEKPRSTMPEAEFLLTPEVFCNGDVYGGIHCTPTHEVSKGHRLIVWLKETR